MEDLLPEMLMYRYHTFQKSNRKQEVECSRSTHAVLESREDGCEACFNRRDPPSSSIESTVDD